MTAVHVTLGELHLKPPIGFRAGIIMSAVFGLTSFAPIEDFYLKGFSMGAQSSSLLVHFITHSPFVP